jgi:hypothetical protein
VQLLLVASAKDLDAESAVFKAFKQVAKGALKGKVVFVTVNLDGQSKDPVISFFGIKEENAPMVRAAPALLVLVRWVWRCK